MDVHIIEAQGPSGGGAASMRESLGGVPSQRITGDGWVGTTEVRSGMDGDRPVRRLAATLSADGTLMSCWVSYFSDDQAASAQGLVRGVSHRSAPAGLLGRLFGRKRG